MTMNSSTRKKRKPGKQATYKIHCVRGRVGLNTGAAARTLPVRAERGVCSPSFSPGRLLKDFRLCATVRWTRYSNQ
jgi:hypothetical protein